MWEGTSCERQARGKARARDGVVERRAGKASEEGSDLTCVVAGKLRSASVAQFQVSCILPLRHNLYLLGYG